MTPPTRPYDPRDADPLTVPEQPVRRSEDPDPRWLLVVIAAAVIVGILVAVALWGGRP